MANMTISTALMSKLDGFDFKVAALTLEHKGDEDWLGVGEQDSTIWLGFARARNKYVWVIYMVHRKMFLETLTDEEQQELALLLDQVREKKRCAESSNAVPDP